MPIVILIFLFAAISARGEAPAPASDLEFGAKHYSRDMTTARGEGDAWVRRGDRIVRADQMTIDFSTNRAVANGNVHITEKGREIYATHVDYNLRGDDAQMENVRILSGQVVITGEAVNKIDGRTFEITNGSYSNCNVDLTKDPGVSDCALDWKLHGRRMHVTMGEYAHIYDVLLYAKNLPVMYIPYLLVPVKTQRQSGILMASWPYSQATGQGFSLPYYIVLGDWQDVTVTPTFYLGDPGSKWGGSNLHLGIDYRYVYSGATRGSFQFFLLSRKYLAPYGRDWIDPDPSHPGDFLPPPVNANDRGAGRVLGVFGDAAVNVSNTISLGGRHQARQVFRLVSNPIYTFDFPGDIDTSMGYLRSQIVFNFPFDQWLIAAQVQHHQSLVISEDPRHPKANPKLGYSRTDMGSVTQLPSITVARTNTSLFGNLISYEADLQLNNYWRNTDIDPLLGTNANRVSNDVRKDFFGGGDPYYQRTGRRLQLEPRLIASVPMPPGFQLQPVLRGGTLAYQFDAPTASTPHREYAYLEVPFSIYLSKLYHSSIEGYEKISHVFQPRVIYAQNLYQSPEPLNPFFFTQPTAGESLSNPRFDIIDRLTDYQYMRFELINRLRRQTPAGIERFFLFQVSEQFNVKTFDPKKTNYYDPRFRQDIGPVEVLGELKLWRFAAQLQAQYQLKPVDRKDIPGYANARVHEYDFSSGITYTAENGDHATLNSLFNNRADPRAIQQSMMLYYFKTLPTFFDVDGHIEYSLRAGRVVSYSLGLMFAGKPRSCWRLVTRFGLNGTNNQPYFNFGFSLDFGSPGGLGS